MYARIEFPIVPGFLPLSKLYPHAVLSAITCRCTALVGLTGVVPVGGGLGLSLPYLL